MSRSQAEPRVIGIETSTTRCEIALSLGNAIQATAQLPAGSRPTASLIPAIQALCASRGWSMRQTDLICVDIGPGSYTGLRVGLTCAKTLAYASGGALVAVGSLETVASGAPVEEKVLEVAFDAARGQVFAGKFVRQDDHWSASSEVRIVAANEWAETLDPAALVTGPALEKYRRLVPDDYRVADPAQWWPHAAHVIRVGWAQCGTQSKRDYFTLEPLYLRPSAAEEKRG